LKTGSNRNTSRLYIVKAYINIRRWIATEFLTISEFVNCVLVVNFIHILRANFSYKSALRSFFYFHETGEKLLKRLLYKKGYGAFSRHLPEFANTLSTYKMQHNAENTCMLRNQSLKLPNLWQPVIWHSFASWLQLNEREASKSWMCDHQVSSTSTE